ncbi:hypothetical protein TrVE_jg7058 [Triparma verrucosa]|uniref:SH2 domain-containing protein n=1 Tax=Triparma verrucosa TaxID=1606542 RepID=A0A9W7BPJ5_9STRA|nr:hypothetical protein TrVE_jg7058 [Triparma verrucosa]
MERVHQQQQQGQTTHTGSFPLNPPAASPPTPPSRIPSASSSSTNSSKRYFSSVHLSTYNGSIHSLTTLLSVSGGASIIHYGGHGDDTGALLFESPDGVAAPVRAGLLQRLFQSAHGAETDSDDNCGSDSDDSLLEETKNVDSDISDEDTKTEPPSTSAQGPRYQMTRLAVVSACHSVLAGNAFVEAGVPHVVAVTSKIRDQSVIEFELPFYQALFAGASVRKSFDVAANALRTAGQDVHAESDAEKFVLLGGGDHENEHLFHKVTKIESMQITTPSQTSMLNLPTGVDPRLFIGRNFDMNTVLRTYSERTASRLVTIFGEGGVGKTSLAVRSVRYSCERKSHFDRVNYISFPELGDYFRLEEERSKGGRSSAEISIRGLCRGIYAQLEQSDADSSMSGGASSALNRDSGQRDFKAQQLYSLLTSTASENGGGKGNSSPVQGLIHSSSALTLDSSRILVILDGVDSFISNEKFSKATITFINDLLKKTHVEITSTSREKLLPLIKKSGRGESNTAINDITEKSIECKPLDAHDRAYMLFKQLCARNRTLKMDELTSARIPSVGEVGKKEIGEVMLSLAERPAVLRTRGVPLAIRDLAMQLENKPMDELDAMDVEVTSQRGSERSTLDKTLAKIEVEVLKYVPDGRCASLWVSCLKVFAKYNGNQTIDAIASPAQDSLAALNDRNVSWEIFRASFQRSIDRWTRVGNKPCRQLDPNTEMKFIKARLSSEPLRNDMVTFEQFIKFCEWWSPSLLTLIKLSSIWQCQQPLLLHGFYGRTVSQNALKGKRVGTFLIRLSESRYGWLAISFNDSKKSRSNPERMKISPDHCLVQVNENGFTLYFAKGQRTYTSLNDLVFDCRKLMYLANGSETAIDKKLAFSKVKSNYANYASAGNNGSSNGYSSNLAGT